MKKLILIIILLLTFSTTTYANATDHEGKEIEPLKTTDGYLYANDTVKANIANLKQHTLIIMLQKDGLAYRGAGTPIDKRHILTVNHVAATTAGSNNYYRTEENGAPYDCKVIKQDPDHDISILEIDKSAPDLIEPMTFADPNAGDFIFTIGHPNAGLYSLTVGRASNNAGRLDIKVYEGNSGGFVMNTQGELVGMVTSMQAQVGNLAYMTVNSDIMEFMGS